MDSTTRSEQSFIACQGYVRRHVPHHGLSVLLLPHRATMSPDTVTSPPKTSHSPNQITSTQKYDISDSLGQAPNYPCHESSATAQALPLRCPPVLSVCPRSFPLREHDKRQTTNDKRQTTNEPSPVIPSCPPYSGRSCRSSVQYSTVPLLARTFSKPSLSNNLRSHTTQLVSHGIPKGNHANGVLRLPPSEALSIQ